jgi:hypothetical protein
LDGDTTVEGNHYLSRAEEILAILDTHAAAWKPILAAYYGIEFSNAITKETRAGLISLIPLIPYIGGDENPMTRHLLRSTTSLALYKAMKSRGKSAEETGKVIYEAVVDSVSRMQERSFELSDDFIQKEKFLAQESQKRAYPGNWVWEFVEGNGVDFDYGYDFLECGTQKLYHAQGADEFLPYYCYLDFVTQHTTGWGFARSMTLAEGFHKCDFRWKKSGITRKGWPPPFLTGE